MWNLRGHNADLTVLRPKLEEQLGRHEFGVIILDPTCKVPGRRDENANGDIASLMSERTTASYLSRLSQAGVIVKSGGLYWVKAVNCNCNIPIIKMQQYSRKEKETPS